MSRLLWRGNSRYLRNHPWQMILAIVGVTLGVAVVLAVDLATESASRAFRLSMDEVSGRATHQIIAGPTGLDETLYTRLRVEAGVREAAPVIEAFARVAGETLRLMGVDPFSEGTFRTYLASPGNAGWLRLISQPESVLMSRKTAQRLGLAADQRFTLELAGEDFELALIAFLDDDKGSDSTLDGLIMADIATVQELTGSYGKLSWIDLVLPDNQEAKLRQRITELLPEDAELVRASSRTEAMQEMVKAFRTNLSAMSLLALIVGLFLIYNTLTFTVLQRRRSIGTFRVLGVTRAQLFILVLAEAAVIGLIGSILGLLLGIWLAQGLIHLVTRTINELYFVVHVSQVQLLPLSLVKGLALGLVATVLTAAMPALEATRTTPQAALRRSVLETRTTAAVPRLALFGVGLSLLALLVLLLPTRSLTVGFVSLFMLIVGLSLLVPLVVSVMVRIAAPLMGRAFGLQARLAIRGIGGALSRTGPAIAALMLAVSTTVGVGVMVHSFRAAVQTWLESTLQADIYISRPGVLATRNQAGLDPGIVARLAGLAGIDEISTGRTVSVESGTGLTRVFALGVAAGRQPHYRLKEGEPEVVWRKFLRNKAVVVSEPLAYQRSIAIGDSIELRTDRGMRQFPVAGIYYNYSTGPGLVLMHRDLYEQYWHDRDIGALGIYLEPGALPAQVMRSIRERIGPDQGLWISSNRDIRRESLEVFDRTFTITQVLRLLVIVVAFVGILNALMALQLERAREFAILRATGFTVSQIWGLVVLQTGIMGVTAGLLSLPMGLVLAELLIHVINRRAFGWSMQFQVDPLVLLQALLLAVVAALLAGIYPAWRMSRTVPARALQEE